MDPFIETISTVSGSGNNAIPLGLLLIRLALNTIVVLVMIFGIYRFKQLNTPSTRDLTFTFVIFNILIFFIASLLAVSSMKTGIAFALFAIFSILRYRTVQMEIIDMTFLFICIILAVINSTVTRSVATELIFSIDLFILIATAFLKHLLIKKRGITLSIRFEKIELLHANKKEELYGELHRRTGLIIQSVEIVNLNFTQDLADLLVHCSDSSGNYALESKPV